MTELNFKGKEFVYNHHLAVPFRPLEFDAEKGVGEPTLDGNLIIHGDNLHALKALLPLYAGKVDCIFIDPPYNTGNENWCYSDNVNAPMIKEWLDSNPIGIEDGLRHDKWCAMMWPRLRLLYELLADDGTIWITLDDNESHRAKLMLDEIFGEENFVHNAIWQKKYSTKSDTRFLSPEHDHILIYAKNIESAALQGLKRTQQQDSGYRNPDNDPRGVWASDNLLRTEVRDYAIYPVTSPAGKEFYPPKGNSWRYTKDRMEELIADNRIWFGVDGLSRPRLKRFLSEVQKTIPAQTIWKYKDVGNSDSARKHLQRMLSDIEDIFPTPKPVALVDRVLHLIARPDALVLDSFAGSGTTAHAVLDANKRDNGSRRFILAEMEDYAEKLTAERVRRVIKGYKYKGKQRTELFREKLSWSAIKKAGNLTEKVEEVERENKQNYEKIQKHVKDDELLVIGEVTVEEHAEGVGGAFTYCTLGEPVELDKVLNGTDLPPYESLGAALFHMATNEALEPAGVDAAAYYLGESESEHVWLIYKPDLEWLKSPDAALTLSRARHFAEMKPDKKHLVFAPARFVSGKMLKENNIPVEFVPLPFSLYRIERS